MNIQSMIAERFGAALTAMGVEPAEYLDMIRPSQDPKFGDFQANFAMPLGKKLGKLRLAVQVIAVESGILSDNNKLGNAVFSKTAGFAEYVLHRYASEFSSYHRNSAVGAAIGASLCYFKI